MHGLNDRHIDYRDSKYKTLIVIAAIVVMILLVVPTTATADSGPKAGISIYITNLPNEEVYLDLLINEPPFLNEEGFRYGDYSGGDDPDYYDQDMLSVLKAYNVDGWRPALVTGTSQPLWGQLSIKVYDDGSAKAEFGYFGVPDRFKIIVVTKSGDVVVSNMIERESFDSVVDFDFATGVATERSAAASTAKQFAITLPLTLVIEGLILLLFRFSLRQNWKPFLFINLITQVALHLTVALIFASFGMMFALLAFVGIEIVIFIAETILFMFLLKQHSKLRRALYSITANAASFVVGLILLVLFAAVG